MGGYHGKYTFETFSHMRGCMLRKQNMEMVNNIRYPPYTEKKAQHAHDGDEAESEGPTFWFVLPVSFRLYGSCDCSCDEDVDVSCAGAETVNSWDCFTSNYKQRTSPPLRNFAPIRMEIDLNIWVSAIFQVNLLVHSSQLHRLMILVDSRTSCAFDTT